MEQGKYKTIAALVVYSLILIAFISLLLFHAQNRYDAEMNAIENKEESMKKTLIIKEKAVSYIDTIGQSEAPEEGCGLWLGSDSTTDGSWGYFIGHNPGPFSVVMDLKRGDSVKVYDRDENGKTYYVTDIINVKQDAQWKDVSDNIEGRGEAVVLQTCNGDFYRIVVCIASV